MNNINKSKYKIDWTNRSILYTDKEIAALTKIINNVSPLTRTDKEQFETNFKNYHNAKNYLL